MFPRDRFESFLLQVLPNDRTRVMLARLIVATLLAVNAETWVLPVTVGVRAARTLVDHESELTITRQRIAEYQAATEYFATPEGREFARRLLYNESRSNERRARLVPEDLRTIPSAIARAKQWYADGNDRAGQAGRRAVAIGRRLTSDPRADHGPPGDSVDTARAREVLRTKVSGQATPASPTPTSPPQFQ